ncbi:threonine aldolase family protein [Albirhodobacter sp. R86504]|jgi:threonine aldolase|uniref:threonine aldolase family protein n=1 Tax=Albirhodobacter sp. R86504 TaxID=3093848 RepID=UPI0036722787
MEFASDNGSGVAPEIMAALFEASNGHASGYGNDEITKRVVERLRQVFEAPMAAVYLVGTGTAANALACATLTDPWGAIFCHRHAHIEADECGAPEFFSGGAKLVLIDGDHGKIDRDAARATISATGQMGVHGVQRGMLSLSNTTEAGTIYTADEVAQLASIAKDFDLPVHMDGARFANALLTSGASPADLTWRAGVDCLSFGGTKNGCMGVEAVIFFDPAKAQEFEFRRKRGGHLFSKHRYLAAQMEAYLADDLWLTLAAKANARAAQLSAGIAALEMCHLTHPTQANEVFAHLPRGTHRALHEAGAHYYLWPFDAPLDGDDTELLGARFVCSWSTTETEIQAFLSAAQPR